MPIAKQLPGGILWELHIPNQQNILHEKQLINCPFAPILENFSEPKGVYTKPEIEFFNVLLMT